MVGKDVQSVQKCWVGGPWGYLGRDIQGRTGGMERALSANTWGKDSTVVGFWL